MKVLDHGSIELIKVCAEDADVLTAMLVSTGKDRQELWTGLEYPFLSDEATDEMYREVERNKGRINFLMRDKHGTPFEHNFFKFRITAPIFVIREWHRHRIGHSYNEQSGRYMELSDKWYIPEPQNVRTRVGKPGHYTYDPIDESLAKAFIGHLEEVCWKSHIAYKDALLRGVAPEQARMFLHVNHYSSFYHSCNARSLMHFLELRNAPNAQWEIVQYAIAMEHIFAEHMPVTYQAFVDNGRIAP